MENFYEVLKAAAIEAQHQLSQCDLISDVRIDIEITGRTHGDLKIEFKVGESYGASVSGNTLEAAIAELLRRKEWNERNKPLMLAAS